MMTQEERAKRTLERRQKIVEFLAEPHSITQMRDQMGISSSCAFDDAQYLRAAGLLILHSGVPKSHGRNGAKYICKQVTLKPEGDIAQSDIIPDNYPDLMLKFLGFTTFKPPKIGEIYHNEYKQVKPDPSPLRKVSAWAGHMSAMEMA
jgi:predicted ArsR family transcriptional regulator